MTRSDISSADTVLTPKSIGGFCDHHTVMDYNSVATQCSQFTASAEAWWSAKEECEEMIANFLDKHPNINCRATTGYGLKRKEVIISRSRVKELGEN